MNKSILRLLLLSVLPLATLSCKKDKETHSIVGKWNLVSTTEWEYVNNEKVESTKQTVYPRDGEEFILEFTKSGQVTFHEDGEASGTAAYQIDGNTLFFSYLESSTSFPIKFLAPNEMTLERLDLFDHAPDYLIEEHFRRME